MVSAMSETVGYALTRENFDRIAEWAGASECWGLTAPTPELRFPADGGRFLRARLGDVVIKGPSGVSVTRPSLGEV